MEEYSSRKSNIDPKKNESQADGIHHFFVHLNYLQALVV